MNTTTKREELMMNEHTPQLRQAIRNYHVNGIRLDYLIEDDLYMPYNGQLYARFDTIQVFDIKFDTKGNLYLSNHRKTHFSSESNYTSFKACVKVLNDHILDDFLFTPYN